MSLYIRVCKMSRTKHILFCIYSLYFDYMREWKTVIIKSHHIVYIINSSLN